MQFLTWSIQHWYFFFSSTRVLLLLKHFKTFLAIILFTKIFKIWFQNLYTVERLIKRNQKILIPVGFSESKQSQHKFFKFISSNPCENWYSQFFCNHFHYNICFQMSSPLISGHSAGLPVSIIKYHKIYKEKCLFFHDWYDTIFSRWNKSRATDFPRRWPLLGISILCSDLFTRALARRALITCVYATVGGTRARSSLLDGFLYRISLGWRAREDRHPLTPLIKCSIKYGWLCLSCESFWWTLEFLQSPSEYVFVLLFLCFFFLLEWHLIKNVSKAAFLHNFSSVCKWKIIFSILHKIEEFLQSCFENLATTLAENLKIL